jgi:hypothetical protein
LQHFSSKEVYENPKGETVFGETYGMLD